MHTPVLLQEVLDGLSVRKNGKYVDATAGEGGHLGEIAKNAGKVLALDASQEQLDRTKDAIKAKNIDFVKGNFSHIEEIARKHGFNEVDGILFDLGLSFWELAHLKKGFSFKDDTELLDMRLSGEGETAGEILNSRSEEELYQVFSGNSEEIRSQVIASKMVELRKQYRINTVGDLKNVIDLTTGDKDKKTYSRIFQALRMEVNHEKENLKKGIEGATTLLKKGGRLVIISFHSVEDRIVKRTMEENNLKQVSKKTPSYTDRSFERSATLRVVEKIS